MDKIVHKSPAKINFGLFITEKRKDGFHNIETVFYPLKLSDTITFEKANTFELITNNETLNSNPENNLIYKAIQLLEAETNKKLHVSITLLKNIPMGAGLGGGSSNAAITLLAINRIYNLQLSISVLARLALNLGSDVPFFLYNEPAFASGRGEKIEPISFSIKKPMLLVNPGIHINTRWAYSQCKPMKNPPELKQLHNLEIENYHEVKQTVRNDFEEIVFKKHPEIETIKQKLYTYGAQFALMSGSGSTVFAIFSKSKEANAALKKMSPNYKCFLENV